jgi:hypothetical protein
MMKKPKRAPSQTRGHAPPPRTTAAPVVAPGRRSWRLWYIAVAVVVACLAGLGAYFARTGAADGISATNTPALQDSGTASQPTAKPAFDGSRAYDLLKKQVAFGPRVPGRPSHVACRDFLLQALKETTPDASLQEFTMTLSGHRLPMANIIARWKPNDRPGVLLSAHWDTRPTADQDPNPANRSKPIPGANDGASGVAVLVELARRFKAAPPPVPVWIVLFDGEDYGPGIDRMFLGSRYFANHLAADTPKTGVLLDMIGDSDLAIPQEQNSLHVAPDVVREIYATAARLGYRQQFPGRPGEAIQDDHLPLIEKGLKVIDLIDFNYPPWHTLDDTPEHCSAKSLQAVGDVLGEWVYGRR